jgi:hypothetical protein
MHIFKRRCAPPWPPFIVMHFLTLSCGSESNLPADEDPVPVEETSEELMLATGSGTAPLRRPTFWTRASALAHRGIVHFSPSAPGLILAALVVFFSPK